MNLLICRNDEVIPCPPQSITLSGPGEGEEFVLINVSESVSKAFPKSSVAFNGVLTHRECHGPSFISLTSRRNMSTGVGLQASHTYTHTHALYSCGM